MDPVTDETPYRNGGKSETSGPNSADRLESWKEIGAFIRRNERTAMRWAADQGMPVRKVHGRVVASRADITKWLADSSAPEPAPLPDSGKHLPRWVPVAGVLAAILIPAGVLLLLWPRAHGLPSSVRFGESSIEALDANGKHLWTHRFPWRFDASIVSPVPLAELVRISDLRGDGGRQVLTVGCFRPGGDPNSPAYSEVDCFSERGKLLWTYVPSERFRFGEHELTAPWYPRDVFLSTRGSKRLIWVAFAHSEWGNSYVVNLDVRSGRPTLRYVNTGSVRTLGELKTRRATYLLVGGFNNEYDGPNLALLNENQPFAASPQTSGTRHKCLSCPAGDPDSYFVFPRSELNRWKDLYEDSLCTFAVGDKGFTASACEIGTGKDRVVRTLYRFQLIPTILPVEVRYSSMYDDLHRRLEQSGQIRHTLDACPERLHPQPIRMWTPAAGWTSIQLPPRSADQ